MHLLDFLNVLRKRWWYVLLPALIGTAGAAALSFSTTPIYQATASVYFSLPFAESANDLFQGTNYTQKQLASYASLVSFPVVLQPVIEELDLQTTVNRLAGSVSAVASNDTVLIDIQASNPSPTDAAAIANAVAEQLGSVVKDLAPKAANGQPAVDVATVAEATPPSSPATPQTTRNMIAGFLGGLFVGILLALARDRFDTRVRASKDLPTGVSSLVTIGFDKAAKAAPLITDSHARSRRAEAYRQLRTNLQFVDVDRPLRVIVVTSSVAGEGKSSTSANLAAIFAETGQRVLLIEADMRRPRVSEYLGLERSVGLTNVLAGQVSADEVLQGWGRGGLSVLPSGSFPPNPSELLGSRNMVDLLASLRQSFDTIIIDTPPLLPVTDAAVASVLADGVVLVVRHGKTTKNQLNTAVQTLHAVDARIVGAVMNMAPAKGSDAAMRYDGYGYYEDDPNAVSPVFVSDRDVRRVNDDEAPVESDAEVRSVGDESPADQSNVLGRRPDTGRTRLRLHGQARS